MTARFRYVAILGLIIVASSAVRVALAMDSAPAIGQLETRDYLVIVHAGPDGPLYTLKTRDGDLIEYRLPAQSLAVLYPELHETLQRGIASPPAGPAEPAAGPDADAGPATPSPP